MKKYVLFFASLAIFASCNKPELAPEPEPGADVITRRVAVNGEWKDGSKTEIDAEGNLVFQGTENMLVFYSNAQDHKISSTQKTTATTTDGGYHYGFSHAALNGVDSYDYYFIMPAPAENGIIGANGQGTAFYVRLNNVQYPTAQSFDASQDYMLGKPMRNVPISESVSDNALMFKRLLAATNIRVTDSENVLNGEPILEATFGFPVNSSSKRDNLINTAYYLPSDNFDDAKLNGWGNVVASGTNQVDKAFSPTVTAKYPDGLAKGDSGYSVWYITLPVTQVTDTDMTLTVRTAKKIVKRTVKLSSYFTLMSDKINKLTFNISGEGYDVEDLANQNDYWYLYNAGEDIDVDGKVINKENTPGGVLLSGANYAGDAMRVEIQKNTLVFVDTDAAATTFSSHLKPNKGSIIIGRYKDHQPVINMASGKAVYVDAGNIVLKNLKITGDVVNHLFVYSSDGAKENTDFITFEDCDITATKNVFTVTYDAPAVMVKNIAFKNCVINMKGTDDNYCLAKLGKAAAVVPAGEGYGKFENFTIDNCVVYCASALASDAAKNRKQLVDFGSNGDNYRFPTANLNITATNNTFYNINANSNILFRAYVLDNANINNNVFYADMRGLTYDNNNYVFGLYATNAKEGVHTYNLNSNYGGAARNEGAVDLWKWKYIPKGLAVEYTTQSCSTSYSVTPDACFSKVDIEKGVIVSNVSGKGANYTTKYWMSSAIEE